MEFAINQHGGPDVHVFDFTNMYVAENSSRILERRGHRLLVNLVGDSLIEVFLFSKTGFLKSTLVSSRLMDGWIDWLFWLCWLTLLKIIFSWNIFSINQSVNQSIAAVRNFECNSMLSLQPFWPRGTGCAHGFLSVFDAAWMLRQWGVGHRTPLQMIVERESIYHSLSSITSEQLCKNESNYTIDPLTRYSHVDFSNAMIFRFRHLFDTDSAEIDKTELTLSKRHVAHAGSATPKRLLSIDWSVDSLVQWMFECSISRSVDLLIGYLISTSQNPGFIDRLVGWLIIWLLNSFLFWMIVSFCLSS